MSKSRTDDARKRTRLCKKIVKLVAPEGMSYEQYVIACAANGIEVSLDNGQFLHWLVSNKDNSAISDKVRLLLVEAVKDKYLLDPDNAEQIEYFKDAMINVIFLPYEYAKDMFEAILSTTKNDIPDVFNAVKSINKAFGLTAVEYFNNG